MNDGDKAKLTEDRMRNVEGMQCRNIETSRPNVQSLIEMMIKEHHSKIEELQTLKDSLPSRLGLQQDFAIFRLLNRIK